MGLAAKVIILLGRKGGGALPAPTNLSPTGLISDTEPDLSWDAVEGATDYTVRVYDAADTLVFEDTSATSPVTVSPALDPLDGPFTWTVFANPDGAVASAEFEYTPAAVMVSLGAVLIYDGTLAGAALDNLGSAGAVLDGTRQNVTIDANGMNFDGDTSKITTPQDVSLTGLTDRTWIYWYNSTGPGESGIGQFNRWALTSNRINYSGVGGVNINIGLDYSTTDASFTAPAPSTGLHGYEFLHNATTGRNKIYYYENGAVVEPTATFDTAGVGTIVAPSSALTIGNNSVDSAGLAGAARLIACIPRLLTSDERTKLAAYLNAVTGITLP